MKTSARSQAARIIASVLDGQSLATAYGPLAATLGQQQPLCRELVYGTLREWPHVAGQLEQLLQKPLRDRDNDVLALMACGLYQLQHMRIPAHAAVSETVATVQLLGKAWARGLVNGVLRNAQRQRDALESTLSPAARSALPEWLYRAFQREWPERCHDIAAAGRAHPLLHLRINQARAQRETVLNSFTAANMPAEAHQSVSSAITLRTPCDVQDIPGFIDGLVSVQDASAQVAAVLLGGDAGEQILDACAAPGGKACHLAEGLPATATLVAADSAGERLAKVKSNRDRLGLDFRIVESDARAPHPSLEAGSFDAILADVPCSATGVIRRHPDIKIIRSTADVRRFTQLQREILIGLWPLLRPGGRMLYATCSVLRDENDAQIEWALEHLANARSIRQDHPQCIATQYGLQCLPTVHQGDGLYYSMLKRDI